VIGAVITEIRIRIDTMTRGGFISEDFSISSIPQAPKDFQQHKWPELRVQLGRGSVIPNFFIS
jgi:hypothetical protein